MEEFSSGRPKQGSEKPEPIRFRSFVLLLIILLVAFALRVYHNHAGLPSIRLFDIEEDLVVERGMGILLGYTPALQWPGSTYFILYAIVGGVVFVVTHIGEFMAASKVNMFQLIGVVDNFYVSFFRDPSLYYIVGRYLQALISTGCVFLVWRIGREIDEDRGGLIGAALYAVCPMGIFMGHVINVDEPMLFLMMWALLLSIKYRREGGLKNIYIAAVLTGISAGAKINGVFGLVVIFAALLGRYLREKDSSFTSSVVKGGLTVLVFCGLGFIFACPYIITDPPAMAKFFMFSAALRVMLGNVHNGYLTIVETHLPDAIGWAPMALGAIGLAGLAARGKGRELPFILVVVYFLFIGRVQTLYERHSIPLAMLMCMGTGILLYHAYKLMDSMPGFSRRTLAAIVLAAVFAQPVWMSRWEETTFSQEDTRVAAGNWIEKNVPSGSRVLMTGHGNPRLYDSKEGLKIQLDRLSRPDLVQNEYTRFHEYVMIKGGQQWNKNLLTGDKFPFLSLARALTVEEEYEKTRLRFLMMDPDPPQPSYIVYQAQPLDIHLGRYIERLENGEFDAVLFHCYESRRGPYMELRDAAERREGKSIFFFPSRGGLSGMPVEVRVFSSSGAPPDKALKSEEPD